MLLACLSLPVLGTYTWLHFQKLCVKQEVKIAFRARMSKERLVRLAFTAAQVNTLLRWEHDREFEYQKQMYDIRKREQQGDTIVFWCWWDQEETLLNLQLEDLVQKALAQDPLRKHSEEQLSHFLKTLYCDFPEPLSLISTVFHTATQEPSIVPAPLCSINPGAPPSPPPQLV